MSQSYVVIPARLGSSRLPNKPLADIAGIPMVVRVAEAAVAANVDEVVVAVDDPRVAQVVTDAGYQAVLTSADHQSGSDRIFEVAQTLAWSDQDVVINVQGDEPLMPAAVINQLIESMRAKPNMQLVTVSESLSHFSEFIDPNIVKVVVGQQQQALYFSRAPIPYARDQYSALSEGKLSLQEIGVRRHVGIYGFRVAGLRQFVQLSQSRLEAIEKLEQLRWLDAGHPMLVIEASQPIPGGVDTAEDLERIRAHFLAVAR